MAKYTINEFRAQYPDDDACLHKIFELRFSNLICPKCEGCKPFVRIKNRRSYQCPDCCYQIYPTKDTVFEKTTTPLTSWFYIIYLQTTTRNGVSAKEIERQLHVCYKTALRMAHQIKKLMADKEMIPFSGICEIDEAYIGGLAKNKHKRIRAESRAQKGKSPIENKIGVIGFLSRGKDVKAQVIPANKTLKQLVKENVHKSASIVTDNFSSYDGLDIEYFKHEIVNHFKDEFVRGIWHTNSIEGFWSQLKRTIGGTHISVSPQHLQKYIDEVAYRYRYKDKQEIMFESILRQIL